MKAERAAAKLQGQTSLAQKVYDAVPILEAWSTYQIHAELRRQGSHMDRTVLDGCLGQLVASKLIKRVGTKPYSYSREPISHERPKMTLIVKKQEAPAPTPEIQVVSVDPMGKLANLASDLRRMANSLEEVAIEIEQLRAEDKDKLSKLHQLQTLLKGL